MDEILARIDAQDSAADAVDIAAEELRRLGAITGTIHFAAPHQSQVGVGVYIATFGLSEDWVKSYHEPEVRAHDPFPDYVMRVGEAMTFAEALSRITPTQSQAQFVQKIRDAGMFDTMAMPIYGPFDFDTYATFSIGRPFGPDDELLVQRAIALGEACNRRSALLLEQETAQAIALSDREQEVLNWIGRSKSNTDIATILDISAGTVDTYVRRLFTKLGTNDRVSSVIKGVRLGLIRF
jgi:DNA-binding CsgD family transcriptional regulator